MIYLNDLLRIDEKDFDNIKIRFVIPHDDKDPLEEYTFDPEKVNTYYFFHRSNKRYFNVGQIAMCFLRINKDLWLLTSIKKITKEFNVVNGINYEGEELEKYKKFFGRLVIKYHKTMQNQGFFYSRVYEKLEVNQILEDIFRGKDFPGYDKVKLSYEELHRIIRSGKRDWISALENQKAVYLITDKHNGKLYVGSATSENGMLLQRWRSYIKDGHGGNIKLKEIVEEKGIEYIKENFQYSILENYNSKVDDHIILERECWWKEVLKSRVFGYNGN